MTDKKTIRLEIISKCRMQIVLSHPDRRNPFGLNLLRELAQIVQKLQSDPPKVLTILAEGAAFSVGGDIEEFGEQINGGDIEGWLEQAISNFNIAIAGLRSMDTTIVVGVQGAAAGGALGLIWAADYVIAAEDIRINMAYGQLGGSPDGATSWFLPRLVNPLRAFELFSLSRTVDAPLALEWGMVNKVVPAKDLIATVDQISEKLTQVPTQTLVNFKILIRNSMKNDLTNHLQEELQGFKSASKQPEFVKRVKSFLGK